MHRRKNKFYRKSFCSRRIFGAHYLLWLMPRVGKLKMFNSWKKNQILLKAD
jgi:hypothetical protein